jgi:hypothetical protein
VAAKLGMRAAFHRTVVAGLEGGGWVEVDLTAPAFDVFDYNEEGLPVFLQPIAAEKLKGWVEPFDTMRSKLSQQHPDRLDRAEMLADLAVAMLE